MSRIHAGLEYKEFEMPSSIERTSVCSETGLLPRAGCPVVTEYFDVGTLPTEYCDQHFYEVEETYEEEDYTENMELTPTPAITVYPEDPVITEAPEDPGTEDPVITEPPEDPSGGGEDGYYDEESGMYIYY